MREWVALQDAKDEGREEGREEGQLLAYMELVKDGDISIEKAASRFGISPEKFRKMMDEKSLSVV